MMEKVILDLPIKDFMDKGMCQYDGMCLLVNQYNKRHGYAFCYGDNTKYKLCPFKNAKRVKIIIVE